MSSSPAESIELNAPACVVLDTNVWRKELLLTTPLGEALEFALIRLDASLGLPEVVERELYKHLLAAGREAKDRISQGEYVLTRLIGESVSGYGIRGFARLPWEDSSFDEDRIIAGITERLKSLEQFLVRVGFRVEHAKAALDRVMDQSPPNGPNNQQYKDSAIWEAVLELASDYSTLFVTGDKGFFRDRTPARGLASNLAMECEEKGLDIFVYPDIGECLGALGIAGPPINVEAVAHAIAAVLRNNLEAAAGRRGFALQPPLDVEVDRYPTRGSEKLAVGYRLKFLLDDLSGTGIRKGVMFVTGEAALDIRGGRVGDIRLHDVRLSWTDETGEEFLAGDAEIYDEVNSLSNQTYPID